jgi:glycosyltransferase involved in cell wall biosynthesis
VASSSRYDLHLAGTIDPSFDEYINTFFQNNPSLRDRIVFHGSLGRLELFQLYSRSRIFCLPSRYETLANVFPEAMYFRNVIVTTENVSLMPVIRKTGAGLIVKRDDSEALAEALLWLINNPALIDQMSALSHEISLDLLNWDGIVTSLNGRIEEMQTGRRK